MSLTLDFPAVLPEVTQGDLDLILNLDDSLAASTNREHDDLFNSLFREIEACDFQASSSSPPPPPLPSPLPSATAAAQKWPVTKRASVCQVSGTDDGDAKCPVCGKPANSFRCYGARVCNSCRAFFSRAVRQDAYLAFECRRGDNACQVDSKSWRSCQRCRFKRCVAAGMKPGSIRSGGHGGRRQEGDVRDAVSTLSDMMEMKLSLDDKEVILDMHRGQHEIRYRSTVSFFSRDLETFRKTLEVLYHGCSFDLSLQEDMGHFTMENVMRFCARRGILSEVGQADKAAIIANNFPLAVALSHAVALKSKHFQCIKDGVRHLMENLEVDGDVGVDAERAEAFNLVYLEVSDHGMLRQRTIQYETFYPDIMFEAQAITAQQFRDIIEDMSTWPPKVLDDPLFLTLFITVVMFNTDFISLEKPELVQKEQERYASLFYRYLKSQYSGRGAGEAATLLHRCLGLISAARRVVELKANLVSRIPWNALL